MVESEFVLKDSDDNSIVIVGGKNEADNKDLSDEWKEIIAEAEVLMLQGDMPVEINILAAKYAKAHDCKVILDMGNQTAPLKRELLENVDVIAPTASQLNSILGDIEGNVNDKINQFMQENPGMNLLVKKGSEGASFISNKSTSYMDMEMVKQTEASDTVDQPAYKFSDFAGRAELIDTTGTEDCFTAAFVVG